MKMKTLSRAALGLASLAAVLMTSGSAKAISVSLNVPNPGITAYAGPYGSVTINLTDSTHASIEFQASDSSVGGYHFLFGDGGSVGVNVNADSFTFGGVSTSTGYTGSLAPSFDDGGAGNEDGFGS